MPHGLVSTGVSFPDGTTQTTASLYPLTSGIQQTVTASATTNIDLSLGTFVKLTHGTNITTLNFTNVPSGRAILVKLMRQKDNSHTIRTISWQSNWRLNNISSNSYRTSELGRQRSEYYPGAAPDNRFLPSTNTNAAISASGGYPMVFGQQWLEVDYTNNLTGIRLLQQPNAVDMIQFLTLDGGTTWRYMGIEWSTSETYADQDFFIFGHPDGSHSGYPYTDGYSSLTSQPLQGSRVDWDGSTNVARGWGQYMGTNIAPYDQRPWTGGIGSFNIPDYSSNNAWHRYDEWRQLGLFGTYIVQYALGQHQSYAINNTGHLFGAGHNGHSGLGRNYTNDNMSERFMTLTKPILSPVTQVAAGRHGGSAIVNGNQLWTWGLDNVGQRGQNMTQTGISSPIQITSSVGTWSQVAEGYETVYAVKSTGTLWAWGRGGEGQIGDGSFVSRSSPTQIGVSTNWVRVKAGHLNVGAINTSGQLFCWGQNNYGQGGNGDTSNRGAPTLVLGVQNYAQNLDSFSLNNNGVIAVKTDGTLWTWGRGGEGQLGWYPEGLGQISRSSPVQVGTDTNWSKVYGSGCANYAIKTNGTLWGWGRNAQWQFSLLGSSYGGVVGMPYREETTHQKSSPIQLNSSTRWQRLFTCPDENGNMGGRVMIALANTAGTPSLQTTVI